MGYVSKWRRESLERSLAGCREALAALDGRKAREALDLLLPEGAPHREDTSYPMMVGLIQAELQLLVRDVERVLDAVEVPV